MLFPISNFLKLEKVENWKSLWISVCIFAGICQFFTNTRLVLIYSEDTTILDMPMTFGRAQIESI